MQEGENLKGSLTTLRLSGRRQNVKLITNDRLTIESEEGKNGEAGPLETLDSIPVYYLI